jgi:hypothetical protein
MHPQLKTVSYVSAILVLRIFHCIVVATTSRTLALTSSCIERKVYNGMDLMALDHAFRHLTPTALEYLDNLLSDQARSSSSSNNSVGLYHGVNDVVVTEVEVSSSSGDPNNNSDNKDTAGASDKNRNVEYHHRRRISEMLIRRIVYKCLDKYNEMTPPHQVEEALKYYTLPKTIQRELASRYGGATPTTWFEALEQLKEMKKYSQSNKNYNDVDQATSLWELILDHPMTSYVPVQCQSCGHVIPDDPRSPYTDAELGLTEDTPTELEVPFVRGGWFRGPRFRPTVFVLTCPACGAISRWYRSRDTKTILNPYRWGRLCGEQEDLRLDLANYLGIPIRTCIPLDWDHIWSEEYRKNPVFASNRSIYNNNEVQVSAITQSVSSSSSFSDGAWVVRDDNARNFAVRLDEGIGSWTGVLAISPDPERCCDVTGEYLQCRSSNGSTDGTTGRADDRFLLEMGRYRVQVKRARLDSSGNVTQAGTVYGYALQRSGFSSSDITSEMKKAVHDYGTGKQWYE